MLKNYTTDGTAAQTGNLSSALAISLLDLALICSIILRRFSDFFYAFLFWEVSLPSSLCTEAGGDWRANVWSGPCLHREQGKGKCLPKSLSWLLGCLNASQIVPGGVGRACLYMSVWRKELGEPQGLLGSSDGKMQTCWVIPAGRKKPFILHRHFGKR